MFICDKRNVQDKIPSPPPQMSMGRFWLQNRFVSLPLSSYLSLFLLLESSVSVKLPQENIKAKSLTTHKHPVDILSDNLSMDVVLTCTSMPMAMGLSIRSTVILVKYQVLLVALQADTLDLVHPY